MLPVCTGWQGTRQIGVGLSHLEPPKSQPTLVELRSSQVGAPTCFLVRIIDQIRYVACVHGMAGNHADRSGLSHLEPPKSQPTLIESSQIGAPTCFLVRIIDQIKRCVACVHGVAGNHADRWGLSNLEPPKSQPTLVELRSSQVGVPTCFFIRVL